MGLRLIDAPEFVEKAFETAERRASDKLRSGKDPVFAAGYFAAIADLTEALETEQKMEEAERKVRLRKIVNGDAG